MQTHVLGETARLLELAGVTPSPEEATLVDLGDPEWRRILDEVSGLVIAVGGSREQGLAALEAGAEDWLPLDRLADLPCALEKARTRRRAHETEGVTLRRRTVGRVSRVVGHEINNALSAIVMYSGLLAERLGPGDPAQEAAEGISQASRRAADLVTTLLAVDRSGPARHRPLDLTRLLRERTGILRLVLGPESRVDLALDDQVPPVRSNGGRLEEFLLMLAVLLEGRMKDPKVLTLATLHKPDGEVLLTVRWPGFPLLERDLAPLRERLDEVEARLLPSTGLPQVELLLPEHAPAQ